LIVNSYYAIVINWFILFITIGSIWKKIIDNGKNKYKCSLDCTVDEVICVKPCFVTIVESNAKWSRIKPCAWYIIHVASNMKRITSYLYFSNFLFKWCPFFLSSLGYFSMHVTFYSCINTNLAIWKSIHISGFWKNVNIFWKVPSRPLTRPFNVV
jgi:hypothetical protein